MQSLSLDLTQIHLSAPAPLELIRKTSGSSEGAATDRSVVSIKGKTDNDYPADFEHEEPTTLPSPDPKKREEIMKP